MRRALSGGYGGCLCQWELKAPTDRSQSDCVHEQVAKADCECPLYQSEVKVWECRNCGHIVVGTKAPEVCPVCNHPQSYFEVHEENY